MASSSPATPDTPVTLKVSFLGSTRRFTLPLCELSAGSLLDKVRQLLCISPDANAIFERHSDSAAAYVELDPGNASVWKQLYRAAKAKRKLKLRVTLHDSEEEDEYVDSEDVGPKPVTVEDEPEQEDQDFAQTKSEASLVSTPGIVSATQYTEDSEPSLSEATDNHLESCQKAMSELQLGSAKQEQEGSQSPLSSICGAPKAANFAVCCNNCDRTIPDAHYHCSTCDDGDFDLCPECVEKGVTCYNSDHWLLKRFVRGDFILVSTTERVSPKPKVKEEPEKLPVATARSNAVPMTIPNPSASPAPVSPPAALRDFLIASMRTCNSCVQELPDKEFIHCLSCDDFDLCKTCFANDQHGHHPKHAFAPAIEGTPMPSDILRRLAPGRDQRHHAICDGCDKFIFGIRHKCLDCPDWDYCADCVVNAGFVHPDHRFVPIYEQIADARARTSSRPCHYGICCDGPLCNGSRQTYIVGERYKCAVCHDTDFCANCEASPANTHNKTHPLIKFKTPVRRVEVKTKGEDENGQKMPDMGDRLSRKAEKAFEARLPSSSSVRHLSCSPPSSIHTVADVEREPQKEAASVEAPASDNLAREVAAQACQYQRLVQIAKAQAALRNISLAGAKEAAQERTQKHGQQAVFEQQQRMIEFQRQAIASTAAAKPSPIAVFERDTIADGTVMPPNQVFEQTWVLRNGGDAPWPAGCSVKFVGGDYMGHVDSSHPAGIHDLVSASESTVCYDALAPGEEFPFTVLLRTPAREGKVISYWRLQTDDGNKFGHRLWCDVTVQKPKVIEAPKEESHQDSIEAYLTPRERVELLMRVVSKTEAKTEGSAESSQMIFPKLDAESPETSIHEDLKSEPAKVAEVEEEIDDFEDCGEDEAWAEDSDAGFLTDEEYDILDASDEEFLDEQQKKAQK